MRFYADIKHNLIKMGAKFKKDVGAILNKSGVTFRVWAPFAKAVSITGVFNNWSKTPMQSENDGYWYIDYDGAEAGQEYKFVIDTDHGELRKNDPRALHMTLATGSSVIVDTNFNWTDEKFISPPVNQQVLYEIYVGTFNRVDAASPGTFKTIIEKLDYLADLGVNMIELMPITVSAEDQTWGPYTTTYLYAIETLFGSRHDFMELVNAAHQKGIGVILDVVYNHMGPGGLDMWQFDGWSQDGKGGIYFYNDWRGHTPWGDTRLDYGRKEVRQLILDNVKMWLHDCHVDGLRVDSTIFIRNVEGHNDDPGKDIPEAWWLLQDINKLAHKIKPGALMIAEDSSGNNYITKPANEGGAGFISQWQVTFPGVLRQALGALNDKDRNIVAVCDLIKHNYNCDAFQSVIYSDSHDSDSNGAQRLSQDLSPGKGDSIYARKSAILAAAIVLTTPGIPMLFQGQEFIQDGYFNCWQPLEWERAEKFGGIVLAHKHLIALRKNQYGNSAGLAGHNINILHLNDADKVLAYHRWDKGGPKDDVMIIINFSSKLFKNYDLSFPRNGKWHVHFNSAWKGYSQDFKNVDIADVNVENGKGTIAVPPNSVLILSQDN